MSWRIHHVYCDVLKEIMKILFYFTCQNWQIYSPLNLKTTTTTTITITTTTTAITEAAATNTTDTQGVFGGKNCVVFFFTSALLFSGLTRAGKVTLPHSLQKAPTVSSFSLCLISWPKRARSSLWWQLFVGFFMRRWLVIHVSSMLVDKPKCVFKIFNFRC